MFAICELEFAKKKKTMERKCQKIIFVITENIIRDFKILKLCLLNSKSCVYSSSCQNFVIKILTKRAQNRICFFVLVDECTA